jgi:hypothetical protein
MTKKLIFIDEIFYRLLSYFSIGIGLVIDFARYCSDPSFFKGLRVEGLKFKNEKTLKPRKKNIISQSWKSRQWERKKKKKNEGKKNGLEGRHWASLWNSCHLMKKKRLRGFQRHQTWHRLKLEGWLTRHLRLRSFLTPWYMIFMHQVLFFFSFKFSSSIFKTSLIQS